MILMIVFQFWLPVHGLLGGRVELEEGARGRRMQAICGWHIRGRQLGVIESLVGVSMRSLYQVRPLLGKERFILYD